MTLFSLDVNVWLALSVEGHEHNLVAWKWMRNLPFGAQFIFCRYTQVGLLRLLTNSTIMGNRVLTLGQAWSVYDAWLGDPFVTFYPEPHVIDGEFRVVTQPFSSQHASKWVGDCWLVAFAQATQSNLVTFDKALHNFARKHGHAAVLPA